MSDSYRYPPVYLGCLGDEGARAFLTDTGLPVETTQFRAAAGGKQVSVGGRDLLPIGVAGEQVVGVYHVDCETAAVVYTDRTTGSQFHVSASPQQFATLLRVFEEETGGSRLDEAEAVAARLQMMISEIDSSAFREDPGFWFSLLFDVAIGDYVDDDVAD